MSFLHVFFVLFQVQELHNVARKEGRQTERMGGKEAENIFSIKVTCRPQPVKLKKKTCVVYVSVAFDVKYIIAYSTTRSAYDLRDPSFVCGRKNVP